MTDFYDSMSELYQCEPDSNWDVRIRTIETDKIVVAPHGGSLEPGTSEVALGIAGGFFADGLTPWNYFVFDSLRASGQNGVMHVTSTNYDDFAVEILVGKMAKVVAVHGCPDTIAGQPSGSDIAWCGGVNTSLRDAIKNALVAAGFDARIATDPSITGTDPNNFINKNLGATGGVQLELTNALRSSFFTNNTLAGRATSQTQAFWDFCAAVRSAM